MPIFDVQVGVLGREGMCMISLESMQEGLWVEWKPANTYVNEHPKQSIPNKNSIPHNNPSMIKSEIWDNAVSQRNMGR